MKIVEDIYVVAGGLNGVGLTHRLDSNIYLIEGRDEIALIDAGVGINSEKIVKKIREFGFDESKINKLLLTHAHLDHSGGAANLKRLLNLEIYMSGEEANYLETGDEIAIGLDKAKKSDIYPEEYSLEPVQVDHKLTDEEVSVGNYYLDVIPTPGHSRGSLSYLLKGHEKKVLFSGDTVFTEGYISLQNLPDSSLTEYKKGLENLSGLEVETLLPSHHGFTINYGQFHIEEAREALSGTSGYKKALR